ncbi:MAG: DUF4870 domain-containing protein [Gammaproteobacteria bacterium]
MLRFFCISFLALGSALALLASVGLASVLLVGVDLPVVSFSAVVAALAFASLAGMVGIIGLARAHPEDPASLTSSAPTPDWRVSLQHLSGLSTYLGVPLGHLLGPWITWMIWRRHAPWLDANGRASLNFALTVSILFVSALLMIFFFVGFLLIGLLFVFHIWVLVRNAWRASVNLPAVYPLSIKFLR